MSATIFSQFLEDTEADVRGWEVEGCERGPEIFAEGARDCFLAVEGELGEGSVVLNSISLGGLAYTNEVGDVHLKRELTNTPHAASAGD